MFKTQAEVKVKDGQNKVIASQTYEKIVFEGDSKDDKGNTVVSSEVKVLLGAAIDFFQKEVGDKGNGVLELLKNATYAYDLGVRASIRQTLVTAAAGPDKAIEKAIKDLMVARAAANRPITEEQARAKVMAAMAD